MSIFEGALKTMALPVLGAVAGVVYVTGWGPYGLTKPMPGCGDQPPCIIVAGLDGDVRYLPTGADASLVDLNDESMTRLVVWLREALPRLDPDDAVHAQRAAGAVLKYPRQIDMGEPGTPNELAVQGRALNEAVALGVRFGADLVVVGGVDGGAYELAFIDPQAPPPQLTLTRFVSEDTRAPAQLAPALRQALGPLDGLTPTATTPAPSAPAQSQARPAPQAATPMPLASALAPQQAVPVPAMPPPRSREQTPQAVPRTTPPTLPPPPPLREPQAGSNVVEPRPAPPRPPPPARASSVEPEDILQRARATPALYPTRAIERDREGVVRLQCTVRPDGGASCVVFSEEPRGWGFGEAALQAARSIRVRTTNRAGQSTVGVTFYETVRFTLSAR